MIKQFVENKTLLTDASKSSQFDSLTSIANNILTIYNFFETEQNDKKCSNKQQTDKKRRISRENRETRY